MFPSSPSDMIRLPSTIDLELRVPPSSAAASSRGRLHRGKVAPLEVAPLRRPASTSRLTITALPPRRPSTTLIAAPSAPPMPPRTLPVITKKRFVAVSLADSSQTLTLGHVDRALGHVDRAQALQASKQAALRERAAQIMARKQAPQIMASEEAARQASLRVKTAQIMARKQAEMEAVAKKQAAAALREDAPAKAAAAAAKRAQIAARLAKEEAARKEAERLAKASVSAEDSLAAAAAVAAARSQTARRLAREEQATLQVQVQSLLLGEGYPPQKHGTPLSEPVPLRLTMEHGKLDAPLPAQLAVGGSAPTSCHGTGGGENAHHIAGELSAGGARVAFSLRTGQAGMVAEMAGKLKGWVVDPLDQHPALRVTVVSAESEVTIEALIDPARRLLQATCRKATVLEVRRQQASEELADAEAGSDYGLLHAMIVKARARGLNQRRLDAAEKSLKRLTPDAPGAAEFGAAMAWERVTVSESSKTGEVSGVKSCQLPGCMLGLPLMGEQLDFLPSTATEALAPLRKGSVLPKDAAADRWLFERISEAALASIDQGGVWRSGGKYIFSAPSRNQSPVALVRFLQGLGQLHCASAIEAVVKWVEERYSHHVSAIQINLHLDASHFHAQHRDIYGLEQRDKAGRDCTCSFKPNIATACLSLGSTRRCLVEAETDEFSQKKPCCPECKGHSHSRWLRSGDLMYFNDVWNRSHTHGIPRDAGDADDAGTGGPRISIALLCAAADDSEAVCTLGRSQPKNIYSTLIDKKKGLGLDASPAADRPSPSKASKKAEAPASTQA